MSALWETAVHASESDTQHREGSFSVPRSPNEKAFAFVWPWEAEAKEEGRANSGNLNWGFRKEASNWRCQLLSPLPATSLKNHGGLALGRAASSHAACQAKAWNCLWWGLKDHTQDFSRSQTPQKQWWYLAENFGFGTGKTFRALR